MALTDTAALTLIDLVTRAEHAYDALTDTWDNTRAARLATLATRYADRAAALTANSAPVSPAASAARDVAARAAATRRQFRVQVRSTIAQQHHTDLPYCDACEDDHPSRVAADGAVICAREGDR